MIAAQEVDGGRPGKPATTAFDKVRLTEWLDHNVAGYEGPLDITKFDGGQSNPTYKLTTPGRSYVLRRKPPGKLLRGAHAVDREARIIAALDGIGFPVPHVYALCTNLNVMGTLFYVMSMVEGRIFWDATFPEVSIGNRPDYFDAMNDTIARLHGIDYEKIGLSDFGRTGNYVQRQISRLSKQYQGDREMAGREQHIENLVDWLEENIPVDDESTIVHGDFRCDNMIFHPTEPRVIAVLDWELSTLGSPLSDFAYHALMFRMPPLIVAGLQGSDLKALNIPGENEYKNAYCRRTGRDNIPDLNFYYAFNFFRLAVIFHGIKARVGRGTASSAHAEKIVSVMPEIARLGWQQCQSQLE